MTDRYLSEQLDDDCFSLYNLELAASNCNFVLLQSHSLRFLNPNLWEVSERKERKSSAFISSPQEPR